MYAGWPSLSQLWQRTQNCHNFVSVVIIFFSQLWQFLKCDNCHNLKLTGYVLIFNTFSKFFRLPISYTTWGHTLRSKFHIIIIKNYNEWAKTTIGYNFSRCTTCSGLVHNYIQMPENFLIVTIVTIFLGSLSQFSLTELATLAKFLKL